VGEIICVEIVVVAAAIRSLSMRILWRLGIIEANIVTMSSAAGGLRRPPGFSNGLEVFSISAGGVSSVNPKGLIVKVAERSREKRSYRD